MKVLNVLLVAVCFSSFAYADLDVNQQKELMSDLKENLTMHCYDDYKAKADRNSHVISDDEKSKILKACYCSVDKVIEKMGGDSFILNNSTADIMAKYSGILNDKNQIAPIIKGCAVAAKK